LITSLMIGLAAYLLGSVSSAVLTCKAMGLPDPRQDGSRNPGTTNVLRLGGKKAAAITLIGDMLKGLLPTAAVVMLGGSYEAIACAAVGSFLGHLWPVWFGFVGGKGVATALGAIIGASWVAGLMAIGTWLAVLAISRYSSLSALITFALAPIYLWLTTQSIVLCAAGVVMSALLFWRHAANIQRLANGTEPKVGQK